MESGTIVTLMALRLVCLAAHVELDRVLRNQLTDREFRELCEAAARLSWHIGSQPEED
jgi:hypothetical protein